MSWMIATRDSDLAGVIPFRVVWWPPASSAAGES
jgi:hypothetical protein